MGLTFRVYRRNDIIPSCNIVLTIYEHVFPAVSAGFGNEKVGGVNDFKHIVLVHLVIIELFKRNLLFTETDGSE